MRKLVNIALWYNEAEHKIDPETQALQMRFELLIKIAPLPHPEWVVDPRMTPEELLIFLEEAVHTGELTIEEAKSILGDTK